MSWEIIVCIYTHNNNGRRCAEGAARQKCCAAYAAARRPCRKSISKTIKVSLKFQGSPKHRYDACEVQINATTAGAAPTARRGAAFLPRRVRGKMLRRNCNQCRSHKP
jgi:hypothetical protein